jgi:SAM-dependent MidA family methyltransferase
VLGKPLPPTPAELAIHEAIRRDGPMTFARFMEMALYGAGGYYDTLQREPRLRDYFTAPMAHPLFGRLLALQLAEVWQALGRPQPFTVVEQGAGDGLLAQDILAGLEREAPDCLAATRYVLVDRTLPAVQHEVQHAVRVERLVSDRLPVRGVVGCILSNELPDAFPVHRFQARNGELLEVYVALDGERFVEQLGFASSARVAALLERAKRTVPDMADGYRGEVCPALEDWVRDVAGALERGVALTADYGDLTAPLYGPARARGTLRCAYRHTVSGNPYVRIGRQDITAHVDFGLLQELGVQAGLSTLGYTTQAMFLRNLGADLYLRALNALRVPRETTAADRTGITELLSDEGFGNFKVLAQGKGVGGPKLSGFHTENPVRSGLTARTALAVPRLTPQHADLLGSRTFLGTKREYEVDWSKLFQ